MSDEGLLDWQDGLIRDGAAQRGYVAAVERLHGSCEFMFRPALGQTAETHSKKNSKLSDVMLYQEMCKLVASHVTAWSFPVEITLENVLKVRQKVVLKMWAIILGEAPSDEMPEGMGQADNPGETAKK